MTSSIITLRIEKTLKLKESYFLIKNETRKKVSVKAFNELLRNISYRCPFSYIDNQTRCTDYTSYIKDSFLKNYRG